MPLFLGDLAESEGRLSVADPPGCRCLNQLTSVSEDPRQETHFMHILCSNKTEVKECEKAGLRSRWIRISSNMSNRMQMSSELACMRYCSIYAEPKACEGEGTDGHHFFGS